MQTIDHNSSDNERATTEAPDAVVCHRFDVRGMSCSHCERAVSTEISRLPGVVEVAVDITTGTVTVRSTQELDRAEIAAAVDEAGYELG